MQKNKAAARHPLSGIWGCCRRRALTDENTASPRQQQHRAANSKKNRFALLSCVRCKHRPGNHVLVDQHRAILASLAQALTSERYLKANTSSLSVEA